MGGRADEAAPTRRWLGYAVKLVMSITLLAGLFLFSDVDRLPEVLRATNPLLFTLGTVAVLIGSVVLPAVGARLMLRGSDLDLSLAELVRTNFSVRFYSLVLPRSTATAVRWLKYRRGGQGRDAFALMLLEVLVHSVLAGAVATGALMLELDRLDPRGAAVGVLLATLASTVALGLGITAYGIPAASAVLVRVTAFTTRPLPDKFARRLRDAATTIAEHGGLDRAHVGSVVGLAVASLVLSVLGQWVYVLALDVPVTLLALLWIRSVIYVLTLFPFTIAGAGVREIGYVALLAMYGVSTADALALALLVLGSNIVAGLVGAGVEAWDHFVADRPGAARL